MEKGLQWETTWLDLPSGEHKKPEYLAINPVGKVPALIDDEVIVHDSTIINEYLEDKFPQNNLLAADPVARARARKFEDYADAYLMPSLFKIFWELRKPENERDRTKVAEGEGEARQHYAYLERELEGRDYFADQFSLGDISFIPPLANLERAGYSIADGFPNLKAWWVRMKARPSFNRSWPDLYLRRFWPVSLPQRQQLLPRAVQTRSKAHWSGRRKTPTKLLMETAKRSDTTNSRLG